MIRDRTPNPRFKTPAGKFRGNPTRAKYNKFGLQCTVVSPTLLDRTWTFSDTPCNDEFEYMDMLHGCMNVNDRRTPEQRLKAAISDDVITEQVNYDSKEVGIECFNDNRWPERTDLKCWWCLHGFETRPFPCPFRKDREGIYHVVGLFCGPSCAKAWANTEGGFSNIQDIMAFIDFLAKGRGYCKEGQKFFVATMAPPRQTLEIFRGMGHGLTIEQFRGLCSCGFEVNILNPPFITHKQIIVADCDRQIRAMKSGRVCHVEDVKSMALPAMEAARQRKEGLEIFAGVGTKRLKDFLDQKSASGAPKEKIAEEPLRAKITANIPKTNSTADPTKIGVTDAKGEIVTDGSIKTQPIIEETRMVKKRVIPDPFEQMQKRGYTVKPRPQAPPAKRRKY